jgi:hypothetical protein
VCPTNFLLPINATPESSKHYPKLSENFYLTIQLIHYPPNQSNLGVIQHWDKVAATRSLPIFVMFFMIQTGTLYHYIYLSLLACLKRTLKSHKNKKAFKQLSLQAF